jgi:uncharacterized membrane protein YgcG
LLQDDPGFVQYTDDGGPPYRPAYAQRKEAPGTPGTQATTPPSDNSPAAAFASAFQVTPSGTQVDSPAAASVATAASSLPAATRTSSPPIAPRRLSDVTDNRPTNRQRTDNIPKAVGLPTVPANFLDDNHGRPVNAAELYNEWERSNPSSNNVLGEDPHAEYMANQAKQKQVIRVDYDDDFVPPVPGLQDRVDDYDDDFVPPARNQGRPHQVNQVRPQQAQRHDGNGRGGGGRGDGGRGGGGRDGGGRVQHPRGVVQGIVAPTNRQSFNATRMNHQQQYPWRLVSFGADTPESRDLRRNLGRGSSVGAIVPHSNASEIHVVDVTTTATVAAGDYDDTEGDDVPIISLFSALVESTIGQALINNLQVNRVASIGDMFRHDFGGANIDDAQGRGFAESIVSTSPVNVMGHAKMLSGDVISTFNRLGQKEIISNGGRSETNSGYYRCNLEYRGSTGNQKCWIVIGLALPKQYLHPDQHANHLAGYDALRHLNAAVEGKCRHPTIKVRLYGAYAQVFCRMMEAPIVAIARAYHFEPVFFFKNMLLRRNPFGNHFELYSVDRGARTSINILGFSRKAANSPMEFLALKGVDDALATVRG